MIDRIRSWVGGLLDDADETIEKTQDDDDDDESKGFIVTTRYR